MNTQKEKALEYIRKNVPELTIPRALPPLPVKYDKMVYIWGAGGGGMVAMFDWHDFQEKMKDWFVIRGWGRISYMEDPEEAQDEVAEYIADAINEKSVPEWEHVIMVLSKKCVDDEDSPDRRCFHVAMTDDGEFMWDRYNNTHKGRGWVYQNKDDGVRLKADLSKPVDQQSVDFYALLNRVLGI